MWRSEPEPSPTAAGAGDAATVPTTGAAALSRLPGAADLRGDGPHAVAVGGVDLILLRNKGQARIYQGRCPHQGALLGEGELDGDALVCRNHRWRFDVETGQRRGGPQCLIRCPVVEQNGEILVDLSPLALPSASAAAAPAAAGGARRRVADLPGPRGLPLLGNSLQIELDRLHAILERWAAQYGPLYRFGLGPDRVIVISDPELTHQVLRARPETFRRTAKVERVFQELHVDGLFSAEGAAWRPQRRLAMEALSHRNLRGFFPTLCTVAGRLQRRWERAAEQGEPIDVVEELKRFTVDVTTTLTFGHDINTVEDPGGDVIQRKLELVFPAFTRRLFALVPLWRVVRSPRDRRLDRAIAELRLWLDGLVAEARARLDADPARSAQPANFLEAMLTAVDDGGQPFSDEIVFANLMTMLLAGEDTTAYTLAWAIHLLCDSPPSVSALRAELDAAPAGGPARGVPADIEATNRLTYAGAVAQEAMRLRPVAPFLVFETLVDTAIGDVEVPAAQQIITLLRPPVLDAARFHEPDRFRPERWLDGAAVAPHDPSAHMPFGSGPRICPGRSLALLEMKILLAMLYGTFDVERLAGDGAGVREHFAFTMAPVGLMARLRRRHL
jgi:cytochrome P450/nitrite reductase/ring-hydroxylating ferredoxin subunit